MPEVYDEEGPLYVVSPKGFSTVLTRVEVNFPNVEATDTQPLQPGRYRHLVHLRGEPFPGDIPFAHQLALAVLKGDTGAALLLADLVQEQHTGSRSELQAEVAKRVTLAIEKERERCANLVESAPAPRDVNWGTQDTIEQWASGVGEAIRVSGRLREVAIEASALAQ